MTPQTPTLKPETSAQRDARMRWWREARFGMFIHWGLYAITAGEFNGRKGGGEWILNTLQIPLDDYETLAPKFNPKAFNAKEWVSLAKEAGMKYIVITSKHHDGFGLWPSKQGDWNVKRTPWGDRDVLKELAAECKRQGVRMCFYHSIMDWHHPDYFPKRAWEKRYAGQQESKQHFDRYVAYMKAQLRELLTDYGDVGLLWFDGEWEGTWTTERGNDLYAFVRSIQPNLIVNNRVSKGRNGMQGMTDDGGAAGDYGTPEQEIPSGGLKGVDWESCMTMNDNWGYVAADHNWKSAATLVQNLVDCASKGGNYLLNVGPKADGTFPPEAVDRLQAIGRWMKANSESIYGTSAGPSPKPLPWGRLTQKGSSLYVHVFTGADSATSGVVKIPGWRGEIASLRALASGEKVDYRIVDETLEISLRGHKPDPIDTVLLLKPKGKVEIVPVLPKQEIDGSLTLLPADADLHGGLHVEANGGQPNIGYWTNAADSVSWKYAARDGEVNVELEYACDTGAAGSVVEVEVAGQKLTTTIASTGSWSNYQRVKLGRVTVPEGTAELKIRALSMPKGAVMNLRAVRLSAAE